MGPFYDEPASPKPGTVSADRWSDAEERALARAREAFPDTLFQRTLTGWVAVRVVQATDLDGIAAKLRGRE